MPAAYTCTCGARAIKNEKRCPRCKAEAKGREDERKRPIRDGRWRRMRALVLMQEPICRICGKEPSTELDHIVPRAKGGTEERSNLQGSCAKCNAKKGAR